MREQQVALPLESGEVDATWAIPEGSGPLLVFAHGAGADHRHTHMHEIAAALFEQGIATLRFNFPFMQAGKRRVDNLDTAVSAIAGAVDFARAAEPARDLFLAGHSFGGRMATHAVAQRAVSVQGLVLCSFPLHPAKKPSVKRAAHLNEVAVPMLFLSGTRDDLADADLLGEVIRPLQPRATLHWLDTATHSYVVLKRSRTNPLTVFEEIGVQCAAWIKTCRTP